MRNRFRKNHDLTALTEWSTYKRTLREESKQEIQNNAPEDIETRRRKIKVGERYGDLVTLSCFYDAGLRCNIWECQCTCGQKVFKPTGTLNYFVRQGRPLRCSFCAAAERKTLREIKAEIVGEGYRKQWVDYQTLWLPRQTATLVDDVRTALEQEFGPPREWEPRVPIAFDREEIWGEPRWKFEPARSVASATKIDEDTGYDEPVVLDEEEKEALASLYVPPRDHKELLRRFADSVLASDPSVEIPPFVQGLDMRWHAVDGWTDRGPRTSCEIILTNNRPTASRTRFEQMKKSKRTVVCDCTRNEEA